MAPQSSFSLNGQFIKAGGGFGQLYNWYAVSDVRGIAAAGWHVPTQAEWQTLITYLGGDSVTGGKLKEIGFEHWDSPNTGATNEAKFNAVGAGIRSGQTGEFQNLKTSFGSWSKTQHDITFAHALQLYYTWISADASQHIGKTNGCSVRLVKDSTTLTHGQIGTYIGNDGRVYPTICIGTQEWLAENLKEIKYKTDKIIEYGSLYNWYAVNDVRGIAPSGWHLPSKTEMETLRTTLGGTLEAGGHLKQLGTQYWTSQSAGADNSSGFNARGGGYRQPNSYDYSQLKNTAIYWTNTETLAIYAYCATLQHNQDNFPISATSKQCAFSVRLIKDDSTDTGSVIDYDGNIYPTIKIGDQVWMAADLIVEHFNNGETIPNVPDNMDWGALITAGMSYYEDAVGNSFTLLTDDIPEVTDDTEWGELITGARCYYDNNSSNE